MSIFLCLIISIAVNLDNLLIGISLGLKGRRLSLLSNSIIAGVTFVLTFGGACLTWLISEHLQNAWQTAGALFLICFGLYCLIKKDSEDAMAEKYQSLSIAQSFALGLILGLNCIPPALSAGMLNIHPVFISLFAGIFSFLSMFASNRFSHRFTKLPWIDKASFLSNILLIMTGFIEILLLFF